MANPTSLRLPEDLLKRIDRRARARGVDRATYLRRLVNDALARDEEEEIMGAYREGRLTLTESARRLGIDLWELFERLRRRGETLSVSLEDWMDSHPAG